MLSVALLLWLTFRFFHWYTKHGETIEVPQLIGLGEAEALEQLDALGLEGLVSDTLYEVPDSLADVPAGHVLDQNPRSGIAVKEGRKVRLFLRSTTPPMVSIPNLVNFSVNVARTELEAKGLVVEKVVTSSGMAPKMELNPPIVELRHRGKALKFGQKLPKGSLIVLVVDDLKEQNEDSILIDGVLNNEENSLPSNLNNG
jgi:eukaryotic-like serine/threonine-protein kinase